MGAVVAIGGGEIGEGETLPIDREIVSLAGVEEPEALFIPTASRDAEDYIETFREVYGEELGCSTSVLKLVEGEPPGEEVREKVLSADVVYVGGGNTREMMRVWELRGVDQLLREASRKGAVLSGLSAGAICWFEAGHSDSESYETDGDWDYVRVDGLGLMGDVLLCPYYHSEDRVEPFHEFMRDYPGKTGLALDDCTAAVVEDGKLRIVTAEEDASAYRVCVEGGEVVEEELPVGEHIGLEELKK